MPRERELHDKYFRLAKKEGYVARSAYKLLEIQERRHTIRPRHWVLDIGCAPGSWLQVVSKIVGSKGRIVGIDLSPVSIPELPNVRTIVGDAFKISPHDLLAAVNDGESAESAAAENSGVRPEPAATAKSAIATTRRSSAAAAAAKAATAKASASKPEVTDAVQHDFRRYDMVMSDMAPATTGAPTADHFRSVDCCRRVLTLAEAVLEPGGNLIMKVFEGESYPQLLKDVKLLFKDARGLRPDAVREVSREIYILGFGYKMNFKS